MLYRKLKILLHFEIICEMEETVLDIAVKFFTGKCSVTMIVKNQV